MCVCVRECECCDEICSLNDERNGLMLALLARYMQHVMPSNGVVMLEYIYYTLHCLYLHTLTLFSLSITSPFQSHPSHPFRHLLYLSRSIHTTRPTQYAQYNTRTILVIRLTV
jgi:hypothetical protein